MEQRRLAAEAGALESLARELTTYHVRLDGRDPNRGLRYVATARRLDVRPYAVVTDDADELRALLQAS
jgi:hypothetical protein